MNCDLHAQDVHKDKSWVGWSVRSVWAVRSFSSLDLWRICHNSPQARCSGSSKAFLLTRSIQWNYQEPISTLASIQTNGTAHIFINNHIWDWITDRLGGAAVNPISAWMLPKSIWCCWSPVVQKHQHDLEEMRRKRFYSPSGAVKEKHDVPEDVEHWAQCRPSQLNRDAMRGGGGGGVGGLRCGTGNKPHWDIPIHIRNYHPDTTTVTNTELTWHHFARCNELHRFKHL